MDPNQTNVARLGEDLPLGRIKELLSQLRGETQEQLSWELGIYFDTLAEAIREYAVRIHGLEEENRQLQDRLSRGQQEYVELRESMDELLNLHELAEAISSSFKIEGIIDALMDLSKRFVGYEGCGVFALREEESVLDPLAVRSVGGQLEKQVRSQWEDGIIDWVFRERRPVVIEDIDTVDREDGRESSFVIIPLIVGGKRIGIYSLYCRRAKDEFTSGELELLGVLANQTAVAIENSRLYTDLETAHQQVIESQRQLLLSAKFAAIGELAGGVAHEVNNPLQIILSRVQLMLAQSQGNEQAKRGLGLIENNVKRISRIIRALLGFSRHNSESANWGEYDVGQAISQACDLVRHQLDSHEIDIVLDIGDLPRVAGNVGEIEQVFINLILNAQNAMDRGGTLRITGFAEEDGVCVSFADTGGGIQPEHLDRIFEPFFTTRAEKGGTGLGLAVSYRIVDTHQGSIRVESTPGEGTTFTVRLPLDPEQSVVASDAL